MAKALIILGAMWAGLGLIWTLATLRSGEYPGIWVIPLIVAALGLAPLLVGVGRIKIAPPGAADKGVRRPTGWLLLVLGGLWLLVVGGGAAAVLLSQLWYLFRGDDIMSDLPLMIIIIGVLGVIPGLWMVRTGLMLAGGGSRRSAERAWNVRGRPKRTSG